MMELREAIAEMLAGYMDSRCVTSPETLADRILTISEIAEALKQTGHEADEVDPNNPLLAKVPKALRAQFPNAFWASISKGSDYTIEAIIDGTRRKATIPLPWVPRPYEEAIESLSQQLATPPAEPEA
jgi:hypothetical protein